MVILPVPQISAGLLMYRNTGPIVEVFLVHPGGPFWAKKDEGAWSIPKGLVDPGESNLDAARREFEEETSIRSLGPFIDLGEIRQKSGKRILAWAFQRSGSLPSVKSNLFALEWPPRSGRQTDFPEIDKWEFFSMAEARKKINRSQVEFLRRLELYLETIRPHRPAEQSPEL